MELFGLLLGLFVLVTFFMPWVNFFSIRRLRDDIDALKKSIGSKSAGQVQENSNEWPEESTWRSQPEEPDESVPPITSLPIAVQNDLEERMNAAMATYHTQANKEENPFAKMKMPRVERAERVKEDIFKPAMSFEQNLGTKISVWLGSIALIFAAFYLVKYSIDQGWLNPAVRLTLSGLFGISLIAGGQWFIMRPHIANAQRIAQGLVGAGVVTLYVVLYAALNLYHLVSPGVTFAGMAVVTAIAVVMSLRHGQPIAVFGIIGGLLTPMMVGSEAPNAPMLFTYLFFLYAGVISVLVRNRWWPMAVLMLAGVLSWPVFWLSAVFGDADAFTLVIFACAVCGASLFATAGAVRTDEEKSPFFHGFNILSIVGAALVIFWIGFKVKLTLFDWSMLELISLAVVVLVYFRPAIYKNVLWAKMVMDLTLLTIWMDNMDTNSIILVISYCTAVYGILPLWLMTRVREPAYWVAMQSVFAVAVFLLSYLQLKDADTNVLYWGNGAFVLAAVFIGLTSRAIRMFRGHEDMDLLIAIYASAASFFISAGLAIELPNNYFPLAFACQMLATVLIYKAVRIEFLKKLTLVLAGVFTVMNFEFIRLFASTIGSSLSGDAYDYAPNLLGDIDIKLLLPAVLIGAAYIVLSRMGEGDGTLRKTLLSIVSLLALAYAYIFIRGLFHPGENIFRIEAGFIERSAITFLFFVLAGTFFYIDRVRQWEGILTMAKALALVTLFRLTYYDLLLHNPYWDTSQFVGDMAFFNGITITYGMGILTCAFIAYSSLWNNNEAVKAVSRFLGLAFLFALSSMTVSQLFHGGYIKGVRSDMELYSYSLAWLLTGIGLLALGIWKGSKLARMASLCFILLTVGKVFLIDASELKDLYRVFSFLGLGASLIGLSFFYTRYVFNTKEK